MLYQSFLDKAEDFLEGVFCNKGRTHMENIKVERTYKGHFT